ncbi:MAG: DUF3213 domain-containing protein [Euryarchaeota archaeon]|nr:DUF3213 domain-containing protein [Euryarchaeota archaeon]
MLRKIEFDFEDMTHGEARKIQYKLGSDVQVYRAFIDPYRKRGTVIFDKEKDTEEIKKEIGIEFQIKKGRDMTVKELIAQSLNR